jgi:alpha-aminoadipate carrier protein LysW
MIARPAGPSTGGFFFVPVLSACFSSVPTHIGVSDMSASSVPVPASTSPAAASGDQTNSHIAACPGCDGPVTFTRRPIAGEVCRCGTCSAEVEVVVVSPLTLELAPEVREDWGE